MAIPTDISQLSQTASLNPPDGSTDAPSTLDDHARFTYSCIAKLRDGDGYTAKVGMPVRTSENSAAGVSIGYRTSISKFVIANGATVYPKWPVDISGKADAATLADTATTALNSNQLGGVAAAEFVKRDSVNEFKLFWDAPNSRAVIVVDGVGRPAYSVWAAIPDRPTNLSQFANGPGYQNSGDVAAYAVQRIDAVLQLGNVGASAMRANISGFGFVAWGVTPSDVRLKKDIAVTAEDSLKKISRIDFRQFRFRQDVTAVPIDDGRLHRLGVIAQELEAIDPDWVNNGGDWKAPDQQALLYAALHAIQQLRARVVELEARQ